MKKRLPVFSLPIVASLFAAYLVLLLFFITFLEKLGPPKKIGERPGLVNRGATWEKWRDSEGTIRQAFYSGQVNYQASPGRYEPIETSIVASPSGDYDFQNSTNTLKSFFKNMAKLENVKVSLGEGSLTSTFVNNELGIVNYEAQGEVKDDQITYKNVYPNVDVRYTILPGSILEEFVIWSPSAINFLTQELSLSKLKVKSEEDGSPTLLSEDGRELGFIPPPLMYEEGNPQEKTSSLFYKLTKLTQDEASTVRYQLSKVLKDEAKVWLNDPGRVFPIIIDATVTKTYPGQTKDGHLYRQCRRIPYADCRVSTITAWDRGLALSLGQIYDARFDEWTLYRSYISFNTLGIPAGATLLSANLYMSIRSDTSNNDFDIKFYSGDWSEPGQTLGTEDWENGSDYVGVFRNTNGISTDTTYSYSFDPNKLDSIIDRLGETQFRFTSNLEEAGTQPSGNEDISFYSGSAGGFAPRLEVTYQAPNQSPLAPSSPSPSDGSQNQSVFSDLSWSGGDPDAGDTVTYDVYLKKPTDSDLTLVSANQTATTFDLTQVYDPPRALDYGASYLWQIVARDGFGAETQGDVWNFTTAAAPSHSFSGETCDGRLEKRSGGGPFTSCQAQMDAIVAATPIVPQGAIIDPNPLVGFTSLDCSSTGWMSRTYISFDTSGIPGGATVYSADLCLTLYNNYGIPSTVITGEQDFVDFGIYSCRRDGNFDYWGTCTDPANPLDWLDSSDWDACSNYEGNILEDMGGSPGVNDVTYCLPINPVSINKAGKTQFRIRRQYYLEDYVNPSTGSFDSYVQFYSADQPPITGYAPRLVINTDIALPPVISLDPDTIDFGSITEGEDITESLSFKIWNGVGGTTLNWSASETASWFRVSPLSGSSTGPNEQTEVTVTLENTFDLNAGPGGTPRIYDETITIEDPTNPGVTPQGVLVTLTVNPAGAVSPWFQTKGGDVHGNEEVGTTIPIGLSTYFSLDPRGVVSTGETAFLGNIGDQMSSPAPGWQVAHETENLSGFGTNKIKYDYDYFEQKIASPQDLEESPPAAILNNLNGFYKVTGSGNLTINTNFNVVNQVVILVPGDLRINNQTTVAQGAFLAFIVKGDIVLGKTLGGNPQPPSGAAKVLEGVYIANGSLKTVPDGESPLSNKQLISSGIFVTDADLDGTGKFELRRDLGGDNSSYPAEYFEYRPDFLVNFPLDFGIKRRTWREIAP